MKSRLFSPEKSPIEQANEYIDMYINIYITNAINRLLEAEEPTIIYQFLELGTKSRSRSIVYIQELDTHYDPKGEKYSEVKNLFIGLAYLMHGQTERNDLLMNSLLKTNPYISFTDYNELISNRVREFIVNDTLPKLQNHPDFVIDNPIQPGLK